VRKYTIALIVIGALLLAGGAAAAGRYVITNIHQIKPSVRAQLRGHRGPRGFTGARGLTGAQGPSGPAGPAGASGAQFVSQASGAMATLCDDDSLSCSVGSSVATCPGGTVVVGGGWDGSPDPPVLATVAFNRPLGTNAWEVIMADNSGGNVGFTQTFTAVATCIGGGIAPRALTNSDHAAQVAADLAAARRHQR
jgi:hypothetical protein